MIPFMNARLDEQENHARRLLCTAQDTLLTLADPKLLGKHIPGWYAWRDVGTLCTTTLREVAAKRARLALMIEATEEMDRLVADDDVSTPDQTMAIGRCRAATVAVKHDAAVYSDHPDYQRRWAP